MNKYKTALFLFFFVFAAQSAFAWIGIADATINFKGTDNCMAAAVSPDGGIVLAGSCGEPGEHRDFCIVKFSQYAEKEWEFTYGGRGNEEITSIIKIKGGYAAAGNTDSFGGGTQPYIVELDFQGRFKSHKLICANMDISVASIAAGEEGSLFLAGGKGGRAALVKTDGSKKTAWIKEGGGSEYKSCVRQGGVIAALKSFGEGDAKDIVLDSYDMNGELLWSVSFGGSLEEEAGSVTALRDGGYLLTGLTRSYEDTSAGDMIVIRTDEKGGVKWQKTFGTKFPDKGISAAETEEGRLLVVGETRGYNAAATKSIDFESFYLMLDGGGNIIEEEHFGRENHYGAMENQERPRVIAAHKRGVWYIAGNREYYYNTPEIDGSDFFLLKQKEK